MCLNAQAAACPHGGKSAAALDYLELRTARTQASRPTNTGTDNHRRSSNRPGQLGQRVATGGQPHTPPLERRNDHSGGVARHAGMVVGVGEHQPLPR